MHYRGWALHYWRFSIRFSKNNEPESIVKASQLAMRTTYYLLEILKVELSKQELILNLLSLNETLHKKLKNLCLLKLAQSLIQIKSVSPYDEGCFDLIETALVPIGFEIERVPEFNCETLLAKFGDSGKTFAS